MERGIRGSGLLTLRGQLAGVLFLSSVSYFFLCFLAHLTNLSSGSEGMSWAPLSCPQLS